MTSSVTRYLEYMRLRGFSAETITGRRRFLRRLTDALPVPLDHATAAHLAGWRAGLTVSDRAVQRYVSHARVYYDWLTETGARSDNPAARLPVPRTGRLLPRPIGTDDLFTAIAAAPARIRPWLILGAYCGLRAKEIALLKVENILDHARPPVIIVASDATKGVRERAVPLSAFVLAELATARLPSWGYAFRRCDGQRGPNRPSRISQMSGEYLRSVGIRASLHRLRHWFGTETNHETHDLRLVQELMGHASPSTTAGYAAIDQVEAVAAVEALPVPRRLRVVGDIHAT
jgi:integrase/recombinase XerC